MRRTRPLRHVILLAALALAAPSPAATRPNVVIVLTDDQGWGDLGLHGNRNLSTPAIDSLGRDGASFDFFYVSPVCSPTRAELLTGRYHPRGGVHGTSAGAERLDLDETTIAEVFRAAGYATAAFGKWHNGMQHPYHPNARGFDEFYGFCSGHWGDYFSPPLEHNGRLVRGKGFVIDDFTDRAIEFVEKNREGPFFVYLPYNTPHSPMQVPDRWWRKFEKKDLPMRHREPQRENVQHTRAALAMCENIDWNVGRLLAKLDDLGIAGDTIVLFFCDNGPNGFRFNGGMKGRKGSTDEGGVRSPLLMRWPGRIPAGRRVSRIAAAIDLLPTLADLAGIDLTRGKPLDGVSLKPLLLGDGDAVAAWADRTIFSHWRGRVSARTQRYRLDHQGRLFDMLEDPGQRRDVSAAHADVASRLRDAVSAWSAELLPGLDDDTRPFVVGHPGATFTQLPARDGTPHGGIRRSNRFPNCSFFTGWQKLEDSITWDIEVPAPGRFEVELHATCPGANVGATIELAFRDSALRARMTEAWDPPLRGQENDRVPRTESYVKDFRPVKLGAIDLPRGRGTLVLRAVEIPGSGVVDVRLLMFRRLGPVPVPGADSDSDTDSSRSRD